MHRPAHARATALALVAGIAAFSAGCGPVDAGAPVADAFRKWIAQPPGLARVEVSSSNLLPYTASVEADIYMDATASRDEARQVVTRAIEFDEQNHSVTVVVHQVVGGVDTALSLPADVPAADLLLDVRDQTLEAVTAHSVNVWMSSAPGSGAPTGVAVTVGAAADTADAFSALVAVAADQSKTSFGGLSVRDGAGTVELTTNYAISPSETFAFYAQAAATYDVSHAVVTDEMAAITVGPGQVAPVRELARTVAPAINVDVTDG